MNIVDVVSVIDVVAEDVISADVDDDLVEAVDDDDDLVEAAVSGSVPVTSVVSTVGVDAAAIANRLKK